MALPTYSFFYFAFLHLLPKILINCVKRNKNAQNERVSPVKHNIIIQSNIYLLFQILNV